MVGGEDQRRRVTVFGHALEGGPEAVEESVGDGDHVKDAVVAASVSPVVGLIERDVEHARFGGLKILKGHFKSEGVVTGFIPRAEGDVLEAAQIGRRGRVLIAGVDKDGPGRVLGDVVEVIPTGEEGDAGGGEGEFAPEKFEDGFVGLLDGVISLDDIVGGAAGEDFGVAGVGDAEGVGDTDVGEDEAVFGDGGPEERRERFAGGVATAAVVGVLAGGVHIDGFFAGEKRVYAVKEVLPAEAVGGNENDIAGVRRVGSDEEGGE